jgi:hypothetical protein
MTNKKENIDKTSGVLCYLGPKIKGLGLGVHGFGTKQKHTIKMIVQTS